MRTRKLILTALFLLTLPGASYPSTNNDALTVIRELTASHAASSRKAPSKSARKKTETVDLRARNIYALFTEANPRLDPASAKKYAEIVIDAAGKFKQDSYVIAAIIVHESTVNNKAVSKGGDYGLMQVRWNIHEKAIKQRFPNVKKASDMFDARTNIMFGTEIFADCMKRVDNDTAKGLMRYSAGNTKMRDKVMATVKDLRAKDNAATTTNIQQNKKGK